MTKDTGGGAAQRAPRRFGLKATLAASTFAVMAAATVLPAPALAQNYSFNTVDIQGNARIGGDTILSYAGIGRGQAVSAAELNDAYQRILASGLFETVEIEPQGRKLVIRVVEFPTINVINFEGNRRLKDDELAKIVESQSRRVFSPTLAEQDADRIAQAYSMQGRLAARVQPRVIRRSDNRVDLIFEVFEGGVIEVERIGFVGNQVYSDRRLRRVLESKQAGIFRALVRRDSFVEDRVEFDKQVLKDFYQSRGYVDFRTTGVNAELAEERDGYFVTFNVEEGQQFSFGEISVQSDLPEVDTDLFQAAVKARPGVVYSPAIVENEIARLERLAIREGLDFVRVEPRITRNDRDLTLDVELLLTRGPRIFVERIDIEGNTTTLDRVVRRQFRVVEGDPFNPREIRESAERIRALGFFANADVNAREGSTPQQVIVDVDVEEAPTGSLSFGGTYSTASGFGATVDFRERNFLGRGQTLQFGISTASETRSYKFNFIEPSFLGRDVVYSTLISYDETDNLGAVYDTEVGVFRPALEFPISDNGRLEVRYSTNYTNMTGLESNAGALVTAEAARGQLFAHSLGYTYSFDTRRTGLNPNAGVLFEFGQDFGVVDGKDSFIKSTVRAVAQTKILSEEVTLRATVEGGALNYSGAGSRSMDRFFMGSNVMRGFEYGGIGPREYNGATGVNDALGGNYFAVARLEADFPLGLPEEYGMSGGLFYDVGSLWGLDKTNADTLYTGFSARQVIGFSLFWDTAIGPLRFNFSEVLDKKYYDKAQTFDLTISTRF
ncbi:outer membrane protein assembly factor BamA [Pseudoprimorskyibacter insulae]|uniref:Outer membrane protein assembly factor BamA n=1 Tax=Pseudoprimorskyibacter insulae TaxID=1695997 RepID=A0A2R8AWR5_9RHOB|nr:outer membrane protein assembly factor BamA [Pseudoprimorskyibacter insulae]SPF80367.1 Outer membrane protein assembly factor BamA [Pseudoprimorskyibacter insulae]